MENFPPAVRWAIALTFGSIMVWPIVESSLLSANGNNGKAAECAALRNELFDVVMTTLKTGGTAELDARESAIKYTLAELGCPWD